MSILVLSIDIGTTSMKTVLYDRNFHAEASTTVDYPTRYPKESWVEQDPNQWYSALITSVSYFTAKGIDLTRIGVIAIDAMCPVAVPVDKSGNALGNCIIWMDRRAETQSHFLSSLASEEVKAINGNHVDPANLGPKLMWIHEEDEQRYQKSETFLTANGFLIQKLSGVLSMDRTQCGLTNICNTIEGRWDDTLIEASGLDRNKLPPLYDSTDIVGTVSREASRETGLTEGIPLIAGAMDNVAAGLGCGAFEDKELYISAGTAANVNICTAHPVYHESFFIYAHLVKDHFIQAAGVDYGGAGYKWFAHLIDEKNYRKLDEEAGESKTHRNPLLFLPYMVGQRAPLWRSDTRGVLFGLEPSMNRGDLALAFMEGNVFGVKKILEITKKIGLYPNSGKLTGGCSRSDIYSSIFADCLDMPITRVGTMDTASLGIAMAGAKAIGLYPDYKSMEKIIGSSPVMTPEKEHAAFYRAFFPLFDELYLSLDASFKKFASLRSTLS